MGDPIYNVSMFKGPKGKHSAKYTWNITKCRQLAKVTAEFAFLESSQNRQPKNKCKKKSNWELRGTAFNDLALQE